MKDDILGLVCFVDLFSNVEKGTLPSFIEIPKTESSNCSCMAS
jgi:hypothetical protein